MQITKLNKIKKKVGMTGAWHLLTALTCFLSRKQMQVHTREAIRRKALIPICNCFSMSINLVTGPKSGTLTNSSHLYSIVFSSQKSSKRNQKTLLLPFPSTSLFFLVRLFLHVTRITTLFYP